MSPFLPAHSFPPANERERAELLAWVREVPLVYGAWTHWNALWKASEAAYIANRSEPELWAALLSRTDEADFFQIGRAGAGKFCIAGSASE